MSSQVKVLRHVVPSRGSAIADFVGDEDEPWLSACLGDVEAAELHPASTSKAIKVAAQPRCLIEFSRPVIDQLTRTKGTAISEATFRACSSGMIFRGYGYNAGMILVSVKIRRSPCTRYLSWTNPPRKVRSFTIS